MPTWNSILSEIQAAGSTQDVIRRKYLLALHETTKRNVIVYYSAWLQKSDLHNQGMGGFELNDSDKNGFMAAIHGLDRTKGLDLVLHTPGGDFAATESLVDYLRSMFGADIRAIVPQIAMSAGTMVALACKEILMGKHSSLGPIDPQIMGIPAHGVIEEFKKAKQEIQANQSAALVWQPIIAKYNPTLIGECQKAIDWSNSTVREWLETGMFAGEADARQKAERIVSELGSHELTKSHARHISIKRARELSIKVAALEDDSALQDAVLTAHHACVQTLASTPAIKIIENHAGTAYINTITTTMVAAPQMVQP